MKSRNFKKLSYKGFTLIELIVVIAILAILAVALIPLINNFIEKSRVSQAMTTYASVYTAITAFEADNAVLNDQVQITLLSSSELIENINGKVNWDGPYLNRNENGITPWGGSFVFGKFPVTNAGGPEEDFFFATFSGSAPPVPGLLQGNEIPQSSINSIDEKTDGKQDLDSGTFHTNGPTLVWLIRQDADGELQSQPETN